MNFRFEIGIFLPQSIQFNFIRLIAFLIILQLQSITLLSLDLFEILDFSLEFLNLYSHGFVMTCQGVDRVLEIDVGATAKRTNLVSELFN
jgi:hypothetical protein